MTTQLQKQIEYTTNQDERSRSVQIVVPEAFVRGMRDLGYKDPGKAIAELIDNSKEAGASRVDVIFGYATDDKSETKPVSIAVFDNGSGMIPRMIPRAMTWGGTSRENSREGFGRYGFGLPASCVSIGTRFSVFSKISGEVTHSVMVDLDDIASQSGSYTVDEPKAAEPPEFVTKYLSQNGINNKYDSFTLVLIEKCDNLTRSTTKGLTSLLSEQFGVTYHKVRRGFDIYVHGSRVEPVDPLFVTPGHRFYDIDEDRAEGFDPINIDVKDQKTRELIGKVTVRFSCLPSTFGAREKTLAAIGKNRNERWSVMDAYLGLIVSRNGRVIDTVRRLKHKNEMIRLNNNNDRYVRMELDFNASLDEFFGVTTSKQQIVIDDRISELLARDGFWATRSNLANRVKSESSKRKSEIEISPEKQVINLVATEAKKHLKETDALKTARSEGEKNLINAAKKQAEFSKRSVEEEVERLKAVNSNTNFMTKIESLPGGPFFRSEWIGNTLTIFLNDRHRFFTDVYGSRQTSQRTRNALQMLLTAIGWSMEEATTDARLTYKVEIPEWSKKLELMLDHHATIVGSDELDD